MCLGVVFRKNVKFFKNLWVQKFSRKWAGPPTSRFSQKSRCENLHLPEGTPATFDFDVKIFLGTLMTLKKILRKIWETPIDLTGCLDPSQHYAWLPAKIRGPARARGVQKCGIDEFQKNPPKKCRKCRIWLRKHAITPLFLNFALYTTQYTM